MFKGLFVVMNYIGCVKLVSGMSSRLAVTMSIPSGKFVKVPRGVMEFLCVGSEVSHSRRALAESWLGDCCCK
jgi:hypothetical protein